MSIAIIEHRTRTPWARLARLGWRHGNRAVTAGMAGDRTTYRRHMAIAVAFYSAARKAQQ